MTSARQRFRLKQPSGWFAAGREVATAATLLSDLAFKLFVWLCLHADRSRGSLSTTPSELARTIGRTGAEMSHALEELALQGVCHCSASGTIEIADRFWPYERIRSPPAELPEYIGQIKRAFLARHCVRSTFTPADERLAMELHRSGIPLADVEHAILLGALRKYAAVLNNGCGTPITSLHYFKGLFEEVRQPISPDYWTYIEHKVRTLEQRLTRHLGHQNAETK
jgi:hypothetical protein